jgi:predicted dehydrogenase
MIRIGCVGSDNSHAMALGAIANDPKTPKHLRVSGVKLTHLCGDEAQRNAETMEKGKFKVLVDRAEDMIGAVDAVVVVYRHGSRHLAAATPFLKAGLPVFVDKPLTADVAEAKKLVALARKHKAPVTSFSTVRWNRGLVEFLAKDLPKAGRISGGTITGPSDPDSQYDGLFFYGVHCVELMLATFGYAVGDVVATRSGKNVIATVRYKDGKLVTLNLLGEASTGGFTMTIFTENGLLTPTYDSSTSYADGLKVMKQMFATRKMPLTADQLVMTIRVLAAVVKAYESGARVRP